MEDRCQKRLYCHFRLSSAAGIVEDSFLELGVVGILVLERYNYFRFWLPYCYFRLSVAVVITCRHISWRLSEIGVTVMLSGETLTGYRGKLEAVGLSHCPYRSPSDEFTN